MRNLVKIILKNAFLSYFFRTAAVFVVILFSSFFSVYAETAVNDDIFAGQKVEEGDFYKILLEPSKKEMADENARFFEELKQKKLAILKKIDAERKSVDSAKKTIQSEKERQRLELEKNKARMKNPQSKKQPAQNLQPTAEKKEDLTEKNKARMKNPQSKKQPAQNLQPTAEKKGDLTEKTPLNKSNLQPVAEKNETLPLDKTTALEAEKNMDFAIEMRKKFIDFGMEYKGIKYVWGGKTPIPGFDCSGFVSYTAKESLGLNLSGNAQDIYNKTLPVPLTEALPGDLIFFKGQSDSRVTHVGIYLGANPGQNDFGRQNLFLNAASGGPRTGVIISGLNENYWKKTFFGCGRIIPEV